MSETNDMKKAINYTDLTIVKQYIDEQVAAAIAKFVDGEKVAKYANSADSARSAQSATKATNDSDGNNIVATYLKKDDKTYEAPYANRLKEGSVQAYLQPYPYAKPGYGEEGYDASASNDIIRIATIGASAENYDTYADVAGKTNSTDFTNAEWINGTSYQHHLGNNIYEKGEYIPREDLVQGATYEIIFYVHEDSTLPSLKYAEPVYHYLLTYNMEADYDRSIVVHQKMRPYTGTPSTTEAAKGFKAGDFDITTYGIRISKSTNSIFDTKNNAIMYVCTSKSYEQSIEGSKFNDLKVVISEKSQPRYSQSLVLYDVQYRRIK